jgi:hypothetical protein
MTWVITAIVASTAVQAYGQIEAGKAQQDALEEQARQEKIAAEGRELQRRQELNKVLASNIVGASMSGMASIALESAKQIGTSEGMIGLSEKLQRAQLRRQGAMARSTANIQATSTLLKGASNVLQS